MKKGTIAGIVVAVAVAGAAYYFYPKTSQPDPVVNGSSFSSVDSKASTVVAGGSRKKSRCKNKNKKQNKKSKKR